MQNGKLEQFFIEKAERERFLRACTYIKCSLTHILHVYTSCIYILYIFTTFSYAYLSQTFESLLSDISTFDLPKQQQQYNVQQL